MKFDNRFYEILYFDGQRHEHTAMTATSQIMCVTGASGFLGTHIVSSEYTSANQVFHLLSRRQDAWDLRQGVVKRSFKGDLRHRYIEDGFIVPGATVINLAYLKDNDISENIAAIDFLIDKCITGRASRLIHCSTATVVGKSTEREVDELADCHPVTAYEHCKLAVESRLREKCRNHIDLGILRPTAVFGKGGQNLNSVVDFCVDGGVWQKTMRLSIFNTRHMNLVSAENVAAAVHFLSGLSHPIGSKHYIISEDEQRENTFGAICRVIHEIAKISMPKVFPVPFSHALQKIILRVLHGPSVKPDRRYKGRHLAMEGFQLPFVFEACIRRYVRAYLGA